MCDMKRPAQVSAVQFVANYAPEDMPRRVRALFPQTPLVKLGESNCRSKSTQSHGLTYGKIKTNFPLYIQIYLQGKKSFGQLR